MLQFFRFLVALIVVALAFGADVAQASKVVMPLQLASVEWLVADSEVIVRGVVVDVAEDQSWNLVTLNVVESLKGAKDVRTLKFAAHKFVQGAAMLADSKASKTEQIWILKRRDSGVPGEAPDRERILTKHKIDLHAPFVPGRPGESALPCISVGQDSPALLSMDLRLLKTYAELDKAIRKAIAESSEERARSYTSGAAIAERGVQSDPMNCRASRRRLEDVARRSCNARRVLAAVRRQDTVASRRCQARGSSPQEEPGHRPRMAMIQVDAAGSRIASPWCRCSGESAARSPLPTNRRRAVHFQQPAQGLRVNDAQRGRDHRQRESAQSKEDRHKWN